MKHPISETHPSIILTHCPKCGKDGFEFDGIKKFNCSACGFIYYINPATAVAAILTLPDQRIILTRRKFEPRIGTFDLPGGFVDILERAEDAVKREIKEELNLETNEIQFLGSFPNEYTFKGISYFTTDLAFICPIYDYKNLSASDDVSEAILIQPSEINYDQISFPSIVHILELYIQILNNSASNKKKQT